jgi:Ribonuclease G/E
LKSRNSNCYQDLRQIEREAWESKRDNVVARVHPDIAHLLLDEERQAMEELEERINKRISVESRENIHIEQFEIYS